MEANPTWRPIVRRGSALWRRPLIVCSRWSEDVFIFSYLNVEQRVEVGDDDVLVLHLAPHVLDGVDGGFVVRLRATAEGQLLQPQAAGLEESVEDQAGQLHRLQL